ncbi:MAG TPA: hypothetical protein VK044_07715 [Virgibacillus sp.]|nr:hypothetical protein [Virgibacillus sp.]
MKLTYYNPNVYFLLINHTMQRVEMEYADRGERLNIPLIGPRPPYYMHPVYVPYYPMI